MSPPNRKPDPVLLPHHKAFGFQAVSPFAWQAKIYHGKDFKRFSTVRYFPTTGVVVYNDKRYKMSWAELARSMSKEQRNYLGRL